MTLFENLGQCHGLLVKAFWEEQYFLTWAHLLTHSFSTVLTLLATLTPSKPCLSADNHPLKFHSNHNLLLNYLFLKIGKGHTLWSSLCQFLGDFLALHTTYRPRNPQTVSLALLFSPDSWIEHEIIYSNIPTLVSNIHCWHASNKTDVNYCHPVPNQFFYSN